MSNRIVLNETSYHGAGCIREIVGEVERRGLNKAFVCSDPDLIKFKVTDKVLNVLKGAELAYELYSDIKPNPTIENVKSGVAAYKKSGADYIIAIGGGFGGCTISLVKTKSVDEFKEFVYNTYLKVTGYRAEFYDTEISDGIEIEKL